MKDSEGVPIGVRDSSMTGGRLLRSVIPPEAGWDDQIKEKEGTAGTLHPRTVLAQVVHSIAGDTRIPR